MADTVGVSIEEFTTSVVESYKKGFSDAIACLKAAEATIDPEKMKKTVLDILEKQGKVKASW